MDARKWRRLVRVGIVVGSLWVPAVAHAAQQWGVVNSSGALVRGSAVSASSLGTGTYQVTFAKNQAACAYVATSGDTGAGAVAGPIVATVATRAGNSSALFIQTWDQSTGALSSVPFHVATFCGKMKFAVVDSAGVLARGGHVVSTTHLGTGSYEVVFDSNVSKCAFTASIGTTGTGSVANPGQVTVAGRAGNVNGVFVKIVDRAGTSEDLPFHLGVSCGSKKLIAVINTDGTKARGANVVSSQKLSGANGGTYEVIFNRNVAGCGYVATIGVTGNGGSVTTPVTITTATRAGNANGVFLFIHQTNGATIDEPFHLFVVCPPVRGSAPAAADTGAQDAAARSASPSSASGGPSNDPRNGPVGKPVGDG